MRLIDTRFSGIAKGVGTAKILGRVHSAQLKIADLHLPCAFTIMEVTYDPPFQRHQLTRVQGRDVDLLFGLDMLKAHQACIDLADNVLRIKGRTVSFLPEHELPDNARMDHPAPEETGPPSSSSGAGPSSRPAERFPGSGNTLGNRTPSSQPPSRGTPAPTGRPNPLGRNSPSTSAPAAPRSQSRFPEKDIQVLMGLGVTREVAIQTLEAANGNLDVAASLLF